MTTTAKKKVLMRRTDHNTIHAWFEPESNNGKSQADHTMFGLGTKEWEALGKPKTITVTIAAEGGSDDEESESEGA